MIRRPPRSTPKPSSAASDVYKRQPGWKFPKSDDFQEMAGAQTLSGRILAGSLVPEPKSSLECSLGALVFWNQPQIFEKKIHFFPSLSREPLEAHHSPPLPRHMGRASASMRPRSAWSGGWVASAEMPFPWVAAPACGENFPAGAGDHLRPKTKEGTFFLQKEGDLALSR